LGAKRDSEAVVEDTLTLDDFCALLRDEIAAFSNPRDRLWAYVSTYLAHFPIHLLNPGLHLNNSTQLSKVSLRQLSPGLEAIYQLAREILLGGIETGEFREVDVDTVAACLIGVVDSFVRARTYLGVEYNLEKVQVHRGPLYTWDDEHF